MQRDYRRSIAIILTVMITVLFVPLTSYAADEAADVKYSADSGEEVDFVEDDFNDVCEDLYGETLDYVKFDLPSSSKGDLYYKYGKSSEEEVDESEEYEYGSNPSIDDITFVPDDDYSGTVIISYDGKDTGGNKFSGEVRITVAGGSADEISYSTDSDDSAEFDEDDFNDVCQDLEDADLNYVTFSLPSSSKGVLYLNYEDEDNESKVSSSTKCYYDGTPSIGDISFVPDEDYSGTASIKYKGYDEDGDSYSGTVSITVEEGAGTSGDIEYSVDADEDLGFDEDDFNDFCEDENDETLNYVKFDLPSSSKGVLWYDYGESGETKISASTKYYYDKNPSIDDITFVPNDNYAGNCKISFEGYDTSGDTVKGTVLIAVSNEDLVASDIYLSGSTGSPVAMYDEYFNKKCTDVLGSTLDYVKFTLPSATYGTLYYDYTSANNYTSLASSSTKYYYDDDSPDLSKVAFVSASSSTGTYTIKYTGYSTSGASFTGEVNITLAAGTGTSGTSSQYFSDVSGNYSWAVKYVDTLYSTSVISGSTASDGTKRYNPGTAITRGDFMLYLVKALNLYSASASGNFSDVAAGSYYYDAIATAKALGIAQGTDNKFYPNATITREDAMVLALRAMNISGNAVSSGSLSDLSSYPDNALISSYAKEAVAALIKAGIITGSSDGKVYPKNTITRAESAAMLYRIKY